MTIKEFIKEYKDKSNEPIALLIVDKKENIHQALIESMGLKIRIPSGKLGIYQYYTFWISPFSGEIQLIILPAKYLFKGTHTVLKYTPVLNQYLKAMENFQ